MSASGTTALTGAEILRRLLYLGPGVRLISPPDLREALVALLDQALEA